MFCDFSTPGKDKGFNVYDDIKRKLIEKGVPEDEIAFIHDANTEKEKDELFAKVRSGKVRVLMGSTQKMGAGTNVQDRLIATHDLDCPWRPADLEQRAGRIVRQGNNNPEVHIYRYVTEGTFDAYLWQTVENKAKFISQIMTSKTPLRSCEDVDESVLSYAEVKALCIGDPRLKEKMELDIDVSKLKLLEASFKNQQYALEDKLRKGFPMVIAQTEERIELLKQDAEKAEATKEADFKMTILGQTFGIGEDGKPQKQEAAEALLAAAQTLGGNEGTVGEYRGFKMSLYFDANFGKVYLNLAGATTHNVELGESAAGNLTRLENAIDGISKKLEETVARLDNLHEQVRTAEDELKREFPQTQELREKSVRLAELNAALTIGERDASNTPEAPTPAPEVTEISPEKPELDEAMNFRATVSERAIRDLNLVNGNEQVFFLRHEADGATYLGKVVHVDADRDICVQLIGRESLMVHPLSKLETTPPLGEDIKLTYPKEAGRRASITTLEQRHARAV